MIIVEWSHSPCPALLFSLGFFFFSVGQPHIPKIEKDDNFSHAYDITSLKVGISGDTTVIIDEKDESFVVERYKGKRTREGI